MNKQQCLIAALALSGFLAPVRAQDDAEARARAVTLASEAISAKESGDLMTAKTKLEEVLKLNPGDEGAKEILTEVNKAILAKSEPEAPAAPLAGIDAAAEKNLNLFREVDGAIIDARNAAGKGDFDAALATLDDAAAALPINTAGQVYKERITLARQDILAIRDSRSEGGVKALAARALADQIRQNKESVGEARKLIAEGSRQIGARRLDDADATLGKAESLLPGSSVSDTARVELKKERSKLLTARYTTSAEARDLVAAEKAVDGFEALNGKEDRRAVLLRNDLEEKKKNPHYKNIALISTEFAAREKKTEELLTKARAQYLYGDYLGSLETYKEVLQNQPYNTEAKSFSIKIRDILHEKSGKYNPDVTKGVLLEAVTDSWNLPGSFIKDTIVTPKGDSEHPVLVRMKETTIPGSVSLRDMKLDRVLETLADLSRSYDKSGKGVNFNIIDKDRSNPDVSLTLNNLTLDKILDQVLRSVNYTYVINGDVIEVRPDSGSSENEFEEFPLSQSAVASMTGSAINAGSAGGAGGTTPFGGGGAAAGAESPDTEALKRYFNNIGITFDADKKQGFSFNGSKLSVYHNRRTLDRIRVIAQKNSVVKQVNIEAKFIEVNQGTLNEIAANWAMRNRNGGGDHITGITGNRTLDSAFRTNQGGNSGAIVTAGTPGTPASPGVAAIAGTEEKITPIPNGAPSIPNSSSFGAGGSIAAFGADSPAFNGTFTSGFGIGGYHVDMFIQALEQATGSDLMAAPNLTVNDNVTANIKIAQLLRYPESYSQIQAQVGTGNGNNQNGGGGGGGSVAITAGTPQDFTVQEVGVVMEVTPKVQDDDSIELDVKPTITEFEGFVEYGGSSVAVSGNTTVTVPSGFYQPVFSIRKVETKVTVFDGATVVIGGLTREEVKTVHDKVPVLGDLPLIGKLFRSDGKTSSKRNLMIFVTANRITPSGSHKTGTIGGVRAGTTYQNPTFASPSGPIYRNPQEIKPDAAK